jgi:hypothetical protein
MSQSRTAYEAAQQIKDAAERRRAVAVASRDIRYFAERLRTAQLVTPPADFSAVAFGHRVTFRRGDGRRQAFKTKFDCRPRPAPLGRDLRKPEGGGHLVNATRSAFKPGPRRREGRGLCPRKG